MSSFSADLKKFAEATKRNLNDTVRGVVLELGTRIVQRSPVDTGKFRGNWQLTVGGPDIRTNEPFDKQELGSSPSAGTFDRWKGEIGAATIGSTFYITNSLPYARRLEYEGWSQQAPAGMVRVTVAEYGQIINQVIAKAEKK